MFTKWLQLTHIYGMATLEDSSSSDSDQECMVNDPICEPIDDDEPQTVAASGFSASSVSASTSTSTSTSKSLLDLLKPAAKSTLARKRVREPSARKNTATSKCNVKNIKPEEWVKEFPGEF